MTKLSSYKDLKWSKNLGMLYATHLEFLIEIRWLDKKDYSVWIFFTPTMKVLFHQNDNIRSYVQRQTITIQELNKLLKDYIQ